MQYFQKHVFWDITRQNQSSGLIPSCAEEQIKKAQTINISPLRGGHAPEPIDMPFGVPSGIPDVITHAKVCVNRLRGFSAAAPLKVPFPILFRTTFTTVLHYSADCDFLTCLHLVFTALHGMQTRSIDENSVCLSIRRVHCDKMEEISVQSCIPYTIPEILFQPAPFGTKPLILNRYSLVALHP